MRSEGRGQGNETALFSESCHCEFLHLKGLEKIYKQTNISCWLGNDSAAVTDPNNIMLDICLCHTSTMSPILSHSFKEHPGLILKVCCITHLKQSIVLCAQAKNHIHTYAGSSRGLAYMPRLEDLMTHWIVTVPAMRA